jgi:hypothetical protein
MEKQGLSLGNKRFQQNAKIVSKFFLPGYHFSGTIPMKCLLFFFFITR